MAILRYSAHAIACGSATVLPVSIFGVPGRVAALLASTAVSGFAVAAADSASLRHAAGLLLKIALLYFVTGTRGESWPDAGLGRTT